jgi:transposase-like protein
MNHRIRLAMASGTFQKLSGTVETDETYVGRLAKNMHVANRKRKIHGTGYTDKVAIHGALERGGPVVATVVESVSAKTIQASIRAWVESGATVYTDQARAYIGLGTIYDHNSVNQGTGEYVSGDVHTNRIENFWALYKRAWKGTDTHHAPKHSTRYVDERTFSFNNLELNDLERMVAVTSAVTGKRLT